MISDGVRIIMPTVAPDADPRFVPGPCVVYKPLPPRTNGGVPRVPKINGRSLAQIKARQRRLEAEKAIRRIRNAERSLEATAAQAHLFRPVWERADAAGAVVAGEVTLRALAAAVPCPMGTLYNRLRRLKLSYRKDPPPTGEVWLTEDVARRLVTYHSGNQRGRVNNPSTRKKGQP